MFCPDKLAEGVPEFLRTVLPGPDVGEEGKDEREARGGTLFSLLAKTRRGPVTSQGNEGSRAHCGEQVGVGGLDKTPGWWRQKEGGQFLGAMSADSFIDVCCIMSLKGLSALDLLSAAQISLSWKSALPPPPSLATLSPIHT